MLRANSNFASNEYFLSVIGLIFLRYTYSRFLAVKDEIVNSRPMYTTHVHVGVIHETSVRSFQD